MLFRSLLFLTSFLLATILIGCSSSQTEESVAHALQQLEPELSSKVHLVDAEIEDLISFSRPFFGGEKVVVCHFADDSPDNGAILLLDLTDILAIRDRESVFSIDDFLGPCSSKDSLEDIILVVDPIFEADGEICEDLDAEAKRKCVRDHHREHINRLK